MHHASLIQACVVVPIQLKAEGVEGEVEDLSGVGRGCGEGVHSVGSGVRRRACLPACPESGPVHSQCRVSKRQ